MMNPEVKQKWLEALRSGEYKQGTGALYRKDGKFCCLGVLTDIYVKEHNLEWENDYTGDHALYGCGALLCDRVMEWARLTSDEGWEGQYTSDLPCWDYADDLTTHGLSHQNDNGRTFEEIAKVIEEKL